MYGPTEEESHGGWMFCFQFSMVVCEGLGTSLSPIMSTVTIEILALVRHKLTI